MTITINGEERDVTADTLASLVSTLGLSDAAIATALNGSFVARTRRVQVELRAGDRVEIVSPMQGG